VTGVVFDLEGADADRLYRGGHDGPYIRLTGAVNPAGGPAEVGTDPEAFAARLAAVDGRRIGHNILKHDIPALARHHGGDFTALARGAVDTLVAARLADPPGAKGQKPWGVPGYYGLDQVAQRYGVAGSRDAAKGVLADLAAEFGGYDKIPQDDARYRSYLRDDLSETEAVYRALLPVIETPYAQREMRIVAVQQRMTFNGWRIDVPELAVRVKEEERRQAEALEELHGLGLPRTTGTKPLASATGKEWFAAGLERLGVPVPRTPPTKRFPDGQPSVAGDTLKDLAKRTGSHPVLSQVLDRMLIVAGITSKYAEIQRHLIGDRVHGGIGADQASGRWAMTRPSLTNLGKRGAEKVAQRGPFLPEHGHVLMTFDLDQVDMRAIAALSQDPAYMALFEPGQDAHAMIADAVFGRHDGPWRERSKRCGHGWNYGMGVNGLIRSGVDPEVARQFNQMMLASFPVLCSEREKWRAIAASGALMDNGFGRKMRPDPERSHTQGPALMGQGGARDIMCEGLLRLDPAIHPMLRAVVHDEIVMSVPINQVNAVREHVTQALTWTWRGVPITTGASRPGINWADCYAKAA